VGNNNEDNISDGSALQDFFISYAMEDWYHLNKSGKEKGNS